MNNPNQRQSPR